MNKIIYLTLAIILIGGCVEKNVDNTGPMPVQTTKTEKVITDERLLKTAYK